MSGMKGVKALLFDVFGTVVDWRGTVRRELRVFGRNHPEYDTIDWDDFAEQWRKGYLKATRETAAGKRPFQVVDEMHMERLKEILPQYKCAGFWTEEQLHNLNQVWHRLEPYPDAQLGMRLLNSNYLTCTLSNGNVRLLIDLVRHGNLAFDQVFSGEMFNSYKPNPATYLGACKYLMLQPHEVAMVAAHHSDLTAAKSFGLRTVYIDRGFPEDNINWDKLDDYGFDVVVKIGDTAKPQDGGFVEAAKRVGIAADTTVKSWRI
ncbi:haloacid dehalogenase [Gonapodya prolifera JEL478]|uniref:Haloacid dehalogenase n=1 Tax=Gonapodya prolifera (strain JEL478) TaxID=1344416 RepID=A0A139ANE6_GONPJ|nr:haloacid dehalogenase [Gonapodya prolifera JEL478]|eukprot:KXS18238.1 haloacid dehalogenase [Gonapodya prolifera JEL478]